MAQKMNKKVVGVKSSTWANFVGSFWSIVGLGVAILHSLRSTVDFANETQSLLSGLAFGTAVGILSIIVVPLIYFAIGWVIGYIQAFVFNVIAENSGGIVLRLDDEK
ncbi:MAG: hypothetical protein WAQ57_01985 [Candidatus Saccharimonadales bacterium]